MPARVLPRAPPRPSTTRGSSCSPSASVTSLHQRHLADPYRGRQLHRTVPDHPVDHVPRQRRQRGRHPPAVRRVGQHPGDDRGNIVRGHWVDGQFSSQFALQVQTLSTQLLQTTQQHLAYPVVRYFHSTAATSSAPRAVAALHIALVLLSCGVEAGVATHSPALRAMTPTFPRAGVRRRPPRNYRNKIKCSGRVQPPAIRRRPGQPGTAATPRTHA
jgi:hypothetical protein